MKMNILITIVLLGLFSIITAFKVPSEINNDNLIVATNVTDEYETVMKELEEVVEQMKSEMTDQEEFAYTPVYLLYAAGAAVVNATVALARVAVAVTRAASHWVQQATRNSSGQLLTTIFGMAKANKIPNSDYYNLLKEYQLYQLG